MYSIYILQILYPQYYIGKNVEQNPVIPKQK